MRGFTPYDSNETDSEAKENQVGKCKVKSAFGPRGPIRSALNYGFCGMKRIGVFLLPPGWDASPSLGLEPGPLDPKTSALTMRPPRLPHR